MTNNNIEPWLVTLHFGDFETNRLNVKLELNHPEAQFLLEHVKDPKAISRYLRTLSHKWEDV